MKTRQERYIESLEEQIDRQRLTIRRLRWEIGRHKENASRFSKKTLLLLQALGIPEKEIFQYYRKENHDAQRVYREDDRLERS